MAKFWGIVGLRLLVALAVVLLAASLFGFFTFWFLGGVLADVFGASAAELLREWEMFMWFFAVASIALIVAAVVKR